MLALGALELLLLSWRAEGASLPTHTNDWAPPLTPVAGYTVTHGDCGYPVCGTLLSKGATPHKTMDDIAAVCNATAGCEGFNSNGWLKGCLPPRCPAGLKGLEPNAPSNLYTKVDPPKPLPPPAPPAPVPDVEDAFYPKEEQQQLLAADIPTVVSTDPQHHSCVLRFGNGATVTAKEGDAVQGDWTLLAVYADIEVALERRWQRWSLLVLANTDSYSPITVRKPLGHLTQINLTTYKPGFIDFKLAASDPKDYIGQRIINESEHGEASFLKAAKFLPPIADYVVTGDVNAPVKAVVTMDGTIKRSDGGDNEPIPPPGLRSLDPGPHHSNVREALACSTSYQCRTPPRDRSYCFQGQCVGGGGPIFSAAAFLNQSTHDYDQLQTGVLGGHLRVASIGCYSTKDKEGFEMMALGPLSPKESESLGFTRGNDTVLVALRPYMPPGRAESTRKPYTYLSFSLDKAPCSGGPPVGGAPGSLTAVCQISAGQFFGAVLAHASQWKRQFDAGMQLSIPYAERRQVDMAKGVIVSGSTVFIGDAPNYGTGGNYWMSSPPSRAMMDTEASKGIADSLPLTSLALDGALLRWGLFESALAKVGFYFQHFIFLNGTIDMGHWKDKWADLGDGQYNCTYPDGLTDHGRMLQLFADTVRYTRNETWMAQHIGAAARIGEYLLRARNESLMKFPKGDPRHGMIYGPAEHDTCSMGMGGMKGEPAQALTDGQYMLYYFSVSMWSWRGMVELGTLLRDYPCDKADFDKPQCKMGRRLSLTLLAEADKFKADIDAAVARSVVNFSPEAAKTYGADMFVPSAVVPDGKPPLIFQSMTQDTLSEYSNFRYYSEMLSSDALDNNTAVQLQSFRENNGGCLSGMTRYSDHLDDMPAIGYAQASIASDRIQEYLLLLYGHAANYQGRGSFFSTEQESLYQDTSNPNWRGSLGEIQASFCTPSQMLVSSMTAMQVLSESRDTEEIWLARAAPRRWYAEGFSVADGPTRYGNISFTVNGTDGTGTSVKLSADFRQLPHVHAPQPILHVRVRWPTAPVKQVASAATMAGSDCEVAKIDGQLDIVTVQAKPRSSPTIENCKLQVTFQ